MFGAVPLVQANLLVNGSFEAPVESVNGIYSGSPQDWSGGAFLFRGTVFGWPAPNDGDQFVDIGFGSAYTLSQAFTVVDAGTYLLTWFDNAGVGYGHEYTVEVDSVETGAFSGIGAEAWVGQSLSLTLSAGAHTLAFVGGSGWDTLLDAVNLEIGGVGGGGGGGSAVPDAGGSLALLGSACFSLSLLRRRHPGRRETNRVQAFSPQPAAGLPSA